MRIPITVEYTIPTHIIQPYFSASFNNILLLNKEAKVDRIYFSSVSLQDSKFRGYQFGLSLGVGVRCNVNPTSYFFLKNEFESRMPAVGMGYILDFQRCKSWMINFGYGFKIR